MAYTASPRRPEPQVKAAGSSPGLSGELTPAYIIPFSR